MKFFCARCGYDLKAVASASARWACRCPECGVVGRVTARRPPRSRVFGFAVTFLPPLGLVATSFALLDADRTDAGALFIALTMLWPFAAALLIVMGRVRSRHRARAYWFVILVGCCYGGTLLLLCWAFIWLKWIADLGV